MATTNWRAGGADELKSTRVPISLIDYFLAADGLCAGRWNVYARWWLSYVARRAFLDSLSVFKAFVD